METDLTRLPDLRVSDLTAPQRDIYGLIKRTPSQYIQGPIRALLLSPELAGQFQALGSYIHKSTSLEPRLSELAVLVTAQAKHCDYVWHFHVEKARAAGISSETIEALRAGASPSFARDDENTVYQFAVEIHRDSHVSEPTYRRAVELFGEKWVMELVGIIGYFTCLTMIAGAFELDVRG